MAEPEEIEDAPPLAEDQSVRRAGGGRALAAIALLLSFGAAGLAGYAAWLAWQGAEREAVAALEVRLTAREQRESDEARTLRTELEALAARIEDELADLRRSLAEQEALLAAAATDDGEADSGHWRPAEAEYLLRVANHRLLMERDAAGAENLLALADEILAEAGGLAYHEVRALLAEEMAALRAFEGVDVQGVFLRLDALKGQLDELPLRLPSYSAPRSTDAIAANESANDSEEPPSVLATLFERLGGLVRFRRHDGEAVRPLLPPRQAEYLQLHLRLALDRAQLAALRHDAEIHRASLAAARDWLQRFVDSTRPATRTMLRELDALLAIDFGTELPDISRSLSALRAMRAVPDAT